MENNKFIEIKGHVKNLYCCTFIGAILGVISILLFKNTNIIPIIETCGPIIGILVSWTIYMSKRIYIK